MVVCFHLLCQCVHHEVPVETAQPMGFSEPLLKYKSELLALARPNYNRPMNYSSRDDYM